MKQKDPASRVSTIYKGEAGATTSLDSDRSRSDARIQYLTECFRAAHEEGMFRIRKRDNWLQFQLLVQVALLAIASGLEISGVKASSPYPDVLVLSSSASAVLVTLYLIENSLIGNLSRYVASLSSLEASLSGGQMIPNWDASENYRENYIRDTLPFRFVAQLMSFFLIPIGVTGFRFASIFHQESALILEAALHIILFVYVLSIIILNHRRRARNAENLPRLDRGTNDPPIGNKTLGAE